MSAIRRPTNRRDDWGALWAPWWNSRNGVPPPFLNAALGRGDDGTGRFRHARRTDAERHDETMTRTGARPRTRVSEAEGWSRAWHRRRVPGEPETGPMTPPSATGRSTGDCRERRSSVVEPVCGLWPDRASMKNATRTRMRRPPYGTKPGWRRGRPRRYARNRTGRPKSAPRTLSPRSSRHAQRSRQRVEPVSVIDRPARREAGRLAKKRA
jgi:hypothetical protein